MFLPNSTCVLYRHRDVHDLYGEFSFAPGVVVPCSVITLDLKVAKTLVRADSSASHGRAEEEVGLARLLFPAGTNITEGDVAEVEGQIIEVIRLFPQRNVLGILDHIQVDFRKGNLPS